MGAFGRGFPRRRSDGRAGIGSAPRRAPWARGKLQLALRARFAGASARARLARVGAELPFLLGRAESPLAVVSLGRDRRRGRGHLEGAGGVARGAAPVRGVLARRQRPREMARRARICCSCPRRRGALGAVRSGALCPRARRARGDGVGLPHAVPSEPQGEGAGEGGALHGSARCAQGARGADAAGVRRGDHGARARIRGCGGLLRAKLERPFRVAGPGSAPALERRGRSLHRARPRAGTAS